ncbi:DUF4150 domain-containing protein [Isoalcanivorax indicus]|uniref:DUF4150 domain-containing protein n=1 Tax=Isoalcanivorax indicus TaxID=2202653 RepID=UPI000DB943F3|nr:DUF4150 domain-containing protein [Isoalcanivorax indicus]
MSNILINGRTAVHASSGGVLSTQEVCKTPPFCRPAMYANVATSTDASGTAGSILINGQPACHSQSTFARSIGDEAGTCGGTQSGTIMGPAEFITFSPNVFFEGQPAVRQGDMMVSNNRNTPPAPLQQPAAPVAVAQQASEGECRSLLTPHKINVEDGEQTRPRRRHFLTLRK